MRKTINKLFLIITVISALLLTTGCDLFIKTNNTKEFKDTEGAECSRSERSGVHFTGRT